MPPDAMAMPYSVQDEVNNDFQGRERSPESESQRGQMCVYFGIKACLSGDREDKPCFTRLMQEVSMAWNIEGMEGLEGPDSSMIVRGLSSTHKGVGSEMIRQTKR